MIYSDLDIVKKIYSNKMGIDFDTIIKSYKLKKYWVELHRVPYDSEFLPYMTSLGMMSFHAEWISWAKNDIRLLNIDDKKIALKIYGKWGKW